MIRATTPTHEFILEQNPAEWKDYMITYKQDGFVKLTKHKGDTGVTVAQQSTKYKISFQLTQQETKKFSANKDVLIQMRCLNYDGSSFASNIIRTSVSNVLDDRIMGGDA